MTGGPQQEEPNEWRKPEDPLDPQVAAGISADLQRLEDDTASKDVSQDPTGDRLRQIQADVELVDRLIKKGLKGAEYHFFVHELCRYGLAVLTPWIMNGQAFVRARKTGRPVDPGCRPSLSPSRQEAEEIANRAVFLGYQLFHQQTFHRGRWRPDGGASLKTYFIGACLRKLSTACRQWRSENGDSLVLRDEDMLHRIPSQRITDDPQTLAVLRGLVDSVLSKLNPEQREVLVLQAAGFTQCEIGERLGIDAKAVENKLAWIRQRMGQE